MPPTTQPTTHNEHHPLHITTQHPYADLIVAIWNEQPRELCPCSDPHDRQTYKAGYTAALGYIRRLIENHLQDRA